MTYVEEFSLVFDSASTSNTSRSHVMQGVLMCVHLDFKKHADKAEIIPITLATPKLVIQELVINTDDVFEDPDDDAPNKLIKIANDERDDSLEYEHLVKKL